MKPRVTVVLRLRESGAEVHAMNLQHPRSKLRVPLDDLIERFARHYNRRLAPGTPPLDPAMVEASDAGGPLDSRVPVGNLVDDSDDASIEIFLRRAPPWRPPPENVDAVVFDEGPVAAPGEREKREGAVVLRDYDLPPPDALLFDKDEFDAILRGVEPATLVVVFFEKTTGDRSAKLAPAFRQLARRFWPRALLLRSDVDDNKPLALACRVTVAPTCVFFKNRAAVDMLVDGNEMMINVKIAKWLKDENAREGRRADDGDDWGRGLLAPAA
ncbi:hypothetical protein CTAYLR_006455 [Chrysophaeum taylorii]|uniref:Thioredoxin domain-containing protein n=1 Tax=Chrysophaeum taylorii TaxID=2483200 RepID=A0AAD7UM07_9STRA|nr:hypothetical protein CTAYLR_006455 [Chrysophaeum taylorii]